MADARDGDYARSQAVLIGTGDYRYFRKVPAAENSLRRMADLLRSPACGSWPESRVRVICNPRTLGDLPHELATLFEPVTDVALFYFVGHGRYDLDDRLCLALGNTRDDAVLGRTTSLTFEDVRQAFRASRATTKIAILDCCFAGLAAEDHGRLSAGARRLPPTGFYLMMASGEYSRAWFETDETLAEPQTFFTKYLADIVEAGSSAHDGEVTLGLLYDLLADALVRDGKPEPTRRVSDHATDFVFARHRVTDPPAAPDAEELYRTALGLESDPGRIGDLPRIKELYRAAAERGHADAMGRLGTVLEGRVRTAMAGRFPHENKGGDLDSAEQWYRRSTEHGSVLGPFWLGELFEDRLEDYEQALYSYDVAAARGSRLAEDRARGLRQRLINGSPRRSPNDWRGDPQVGSSAPPAGSGGSAPIDLDDDKARLVRAAGTRARWIEEWGGQEPLVLAFCLDTLGDACGGAHGEWATLDEAEQSVVGRYFLTYQPARDELPAVARDFYRRVPPGNLKDFARRLLHVYTG